MAARCPKPDTKYRRGRQDVSPVKNAQGEIVGRISGDITERKRNEEHLARLAHEGEHRDKNILATVRGIVELSHVDTPDDLKRAIGARVIGAC